MDAYGIAAIILAGGFGISIIIIACKATPEGCDTALDDIAKNNIMNGFCKA